MEEVPTTEEVPATEELTAPEEVSATEELPAQGSGFGDLVVCTSEVVPFPAPLSLLESLCTKISFFKQVQSLEDSTVRLARK
jgi:hypothetical protein